MGNLNCSQFCQNTERSTELDLKRSIVQSFALPKKSIETQQLFNKSEIKPQQAHQINQQSESTIPESKDESFDINLKQEHENLARKIQNAWRIYYNVNQYLQFRSYRKSNHDYFSYEYNKETVSPAAGILKRKKKKPYTYDNGATYKGDWVGGFRDGYGIMNWVDGSKYEGEWSYGYPFGAGTFIYKGEDIYEGEWISPYAHARSKNNSSPDGYLWLYKKCKEAKSGPRYSDAHLIKLKNIEKNYQKLLENLQEHKEFVETLFDDKFSRKFKEKTYPGNLKYFGELKGNVREGRGRCIWDNGDTYAGQWINDKQNGIGRNLWVDGTVYTGGYKDNLKEGVGEYTWIDGTKYAGEWKNNVFHGLGKYSWTDGREYIGEWENGKKNGFGVFTWADGKKYAGEWRDGKKHGPGYSTNDNGKSSKAEWDSGKIVK
ncbi:unnamed protein product [Blepharisma stoltei]|uniref:MORN repeat protein n=1 Tax=Blepharisma stoltei TaxID=1481888 RepID=A0AAU9IIN5_9CILI|nr:unnamed protein product [Blepharisma stoltei]